jgi:sialate O-acetylesterase
MKLASLFSDHMVLQRDRPVPVWGWSAAGDAITVEFAGQRKTAVAGADGKWMVSLEAMAASSEGRVLSAESRSGQEKVQASDVLVGDVWLCSGQSNMEWPVQTTKDNVAEVASAAHPRIRLFAVPRLALPEPQRDVESEWKVCSPESVKDFSAVGYFFGREIQRAIDVPIGLINSSWGGTRIEAWTSRPAVETDAECRRELAGIEAWTQSPAGREAAAEYEKSGCNPEYWEHRQGSPDPGNGGYARGRAAPGLDDAAWPVMDIPCKWQTAGHKHTGVFWFRRTVELPAAWAGKDLVLHLGACDKTDATYFNNAQIGATGFEISNSWCTPRIYRVPGATVRPGRNVIATRVYSNIFDGGMIGPAGEMHLGVADDPGQPAMPLAGPWRYQIEHDLGIAQAVPPPQGPGNPNSMSILYESMINPLLPAALRGAIWYQGESNAEEPERYRTLFPMMIRDWRRAFGDEAMPFFFVQLANYMAPQEAPVESGWAELREAQTMALREPHTGMAVAIDIGEENDIHPKNKQEVGRRLALAALAQVHGLQVAPCSPLYASHCIEDGAIRVRFEHAEGGLKTADGGPVKAFAIAGEDGKFEWAQAVIDGETVVVRGDRVCKPVAVRYAWANNPPANLLGASGLPASPFRTDAS